MSNVVNLMNKTQPKKDSSFSGNFVKFFQTNYCRTPLCSEAVSSNINEVIREISNPFVFLSTDSYIQKYEEKST